MKREKKKLKAEDSVNKAKTKIVKAKRIMKK